MAESESNLEARMELFFKKFSEGMDSLKSGMDVFKSSLDVFKSSLDSLKERHDALTMNLELLSHDVQVLRANSERDGENIRALARIAELHDRRLSDLEGE